MADQFSKPLLSSKKDHAGKISTASVSDKFSIELYNRQQGSTAFKFYVKNKKLIAEAIHNGDTQQLLISGIPLEFQTNLNREKMLRLQIMLEHCYFSVQDGKILVHARGLGGWNEDVHMGYSEERGAIQYTEYGTYHMARIVGFEIREAKIIANACQSVDDDLATSPYPIVGNPPQHFDTYENTWDTWATASDPRIQYMFQNFNNAMKCKQTDYEESLNYLGAGLHSLQDIFAHTPDFSVHIGTIAVQGSGADDVGQYPYYRKTQMVTATQLYLQAYIQDKTLKSHLLPTMRHFNRVVPPKQSTFYKAMNYIPGALGAAVGAIGGTFLSPGFGTAGGAAVGGGIGASASAWLKKNIF